MVYAIIYSLFLGFGITIGSDLFYVIDRPARRADALAAAAMRQMVTIHGQFSQDPGSPDYMSNLMPFNGTFTFSNSATDDVSANLNKGNVICQRAADTPWWRSSVPQMYNIGFVPLFSLFLCLWNMQPLKSRQLPVMVFISCVGYASNAMANHYIFDRSDVVSAIGAFVIGYVPPSLPSPLYMSMSADLVVFSGTSILESLAVQPSPRWSLVSCSLSRLAALRESDYIAKLTGLVWHGSSWWCGHDSSYEPRRLVLPRSGHCI